MASIRIRNGKYCLIYYYKDNDGKKHQKWETYATQAEAKKRQKEVEYQQELGLLVVPQCKTIKELMKEYVALYGKEHWGLTNYARVVSMIDNYIIANIGDKKLEDINTRFLEKFYQNLLKMPARKNPILGKAKEHISTSTVRDIHKILRSAFQQAVKWDLMEKNPAVNATVPKKKKEKRDIWTAETVLYALEVCESERLKLAISLSFSCSLRIGEILGLTWDCVDVSNEAIKAGTAHVFVNKEAKRVDKDAIVELNGKGVLVTFPENSKLNRTVVVLKNPKTESSIRKVFLPKTVAYQMQEWKKKQDETKEVLGDQYQDFNLVMATMFGLPINDSAIRKDFKKLIEKHDLPKVVFHSLRHTSITYKLKLNGGDIKSVQGDSGHSQINMVTDVYSHIIDDDRRKNAAMFEDAFFKKQDLKPTLKKNDAGNTVMEVPEGVDADLLAKVLSNPEMAALLTSIAKTMK